MADTTRARGDRQDAIRGRAKVGRPGPADCPQVDTRQMLLDEADRFAKRTGLRASPEQAKRVLSVVRRFISTVVPDGGWHLDPGQAVVNFLDAESKAGRALKTLLNYRCALSRFVGHLSERGLADAMPHIPMAKPAEAMPRFLSPDELAHTIALADRRGIGPAVRLALSAGLRLSELIRLRWADVNVTRRILVVKVAKGRRPRVIPLSEEAMDALRLQQNHLLEQYARQTADCAFRAEKRAKRGVATRADDLAAAWRPGVGYIFPARRTWPGGWGYIDSERDDACWQHAFRPIQKAVAKFTAGMRRMGTGRAWHLLRHTFASRLAQKGVSIYKISEWLGHRDIRTTQVYAHLQKTYDPDIEKGAFRKPRKPAPAATAPAAPPAPPAPPAAIPPAVATDGWGALPATMPPPTPPAGLGSLAGLPPAQPPFASPGTP